MDSRTAGRMKAAASMLRDRKPDLAYNAMKDILSGLEQMKEKPERTVADFDAVIRMFCT